MRCGVAGNRERPLSVGAYGPCGGDYPAFVGNRARMVPAITGRAEFAGGLHVMHVPSDIRAAVPDRSMRSAARRSPTVETGDAWRNRGLIRTIGDKIY